MVAKKEAVLVNSGLVKNPQNFLKDGWGVEFVVRVGGPGHDRIVAESAKLKAYEKKKKEKLGQVEESETNDDD